MTWARLKGTCARLRRKEVPYLVVISVAIAGWSITHVADRVLNAPVVEYSTEIDATTDPRTIRVTILNLSNKAFRDLKFELQGVSVNACETPMSFEPPAWASVGIPKQGTDAVGFEVSQLQPNWKVTMCGVYRGGGKEPFFVLKDVGQVQSIELRQPDCATRILKHEAKLMLALAAIGFAGIVVWIFFGMEVNEVV